MILHACGQDTATVPAKSERMHAGIAGAELVYIPDVGCFSGIGQPAAVNAMSALFSTKLGT